MSCRAVTFDFNGTLSDDEQILFGVYAELFAEHGRPLRADEYFTQLAGLSEHEIVRSGWATGTTSRRSSASGSTATEQP